MLLCIAEAVDALFRLVSFCCFSLVLLFSAVCWTLGVFLAGVFLVSVGASLRAETPESESSELTSSSSSSLSLSSSSDSSSSSSSSSSSCYFLSEFFIEFCFLTSAEAVLTPLLRTPLTPDPPMLLSSSSICSSRPVIAYVYLELSR